VLGTHQGDYGGTGSTAPTTGCAGLDSVYAPPPSQTQPQTQTALGSWDDCSDGSRARFVGHEDDLQMELDPSRRQVEMGYRSGEIAWRGRQYGGGHYQGEFRVVDSLGESRWTACDVDLQNDVLTLCRRVTCRRAALY
jgi:hypothetical protein